MVQKNSIKHKTRKQGSCNHLIKVNQLNTDLIVGEKVI